jgi:hypothetical protein
MKAIHALCKPTPIGGENLRVIDLKQGLYGSGWWVLSEAECEQVISGWIYLHEGSGTKSWFNARIEDILGRNSAGRVELLIRRIPNIQKQNWRGDLASQNSYLRIVEANLPHEQS